MLDDAEKNFGDDEDGDELPPLLLLGEDDDALLSSDGDVDHIPPKEDEKEASCCSMPSLGNAAAGRLLELARFCHRRLSVGEPRDDDEDADAVALAAMLLLEKVCSLMMPWWPLPWLTLSDEDEMLPLFPVLQRHQGWPSPPPPPLLMAPERVLGPALLLLKSMLQMKQLSR